MAANFVDAAVDSLTENVRVGRAMDPMLSGISRRCHVSVILPCLDESNGVGYVVQEAHLGLELAGISGEVIVVDNGSKDASAVAAARQGAMVLAEPRRGYGAAIRHGLLHARGEVIVIADADCSYDLRQIGPLVDRVVQGADLVIGTRMGDGLEPGAMPWLHRTVGTPFLNLFIGAVCGRRFKDSQSGFRAFRRDRVLQVQLSSDGMELATELIVRAHLAGLCIEEIPVHYRRRTGSSKLRPLADALRHVTLLARLGWDGQRTRKTRYRSSS